MTGLTRVSNLSQEMRANADHTRNKLGLSSDLHLGQLHCPSSDFAQSIIVASLLNLRKIPMTHAKGGPP